MCLNNDIFSFFLHIYNGAFIACPDHKGHVFSCNAVQAELSLYIRILFEQLIMMQDRFLDHFSRCVMALETRYITGIEFGIAVQSSNANKEDIL